MLRLGKDSELLPIPEQVAEDALRQLEALEDRGRSPGHLEVPLSPRAQILFRPEEVELRSEEVGGTAVALGPLPDPDHDVPGLEPGAVRRDRQLERASALMAGGADHHRLPICRGGGPRTIRDASRPLPSSIAPAS